jgi:MFS family permease
LGFVVQAIINNLAPLLFVTFSNTWGLSLGQITMLSAVNFGTQLVVDFLSALWVDRIGYRVTMIFAQIFSTVGLIGMTVLPDLWGNPYVALLVAVVCYGIGGGLIEVLVSPIVEACPTTRKESSMSLLHSFYCWGLVAVVGGSTLFFQVIGIQHWRVLTWIWAIVPIINAIYFCFVPIQPVVPKEKQHRMLELFREPKFWIFMILMVCAGASSQAICQWGSVYAEMSLGVSKEVGDLVGPCGFAFFMGITRLLYGKYAERFDLEKLLLGSGILSAICYLIIGTTSNAMFGLLMCALCGAAVGIFWPGTYSIAAKSMPLGGTALFAFMALAGDAGCSVGPTVVGLVAEQFQGNLKIGMRAALIFPLLIFVGVCLLKRTMCLREDEGKTLSNFETPSCKSEGTRL